LRQADNDRPDWCLDYVTVIDFNVAGNQVWQFPFNAWIGIAGKPNWFDGPVLRNPKYLGPAPYAKYISTGYAPAENIGTSSSPLTDATVACRSLSGVSRNSDNLDIFCADTCGQINTAAWEPAFSDGWHGWWPIGDMNVGQGGITRVVTRSRDHLDVFCVGLDGRVYTAAWEPGFTDGWHGWWNIGGPGACPGSTVEAVSRSQDKLDIFCIGMDGYVYTAAWPCDSSGGWSGWRRIGSLKAIPGSACTAVSRSTDKLDIFCVASDGGVYTAAWEPGRGDWRGWWRIGNLQAPKGSSPVAVSRSRDKLDVFCAAADGNVYTAAWQPAFSDGWHGWWQIGGLRVAPGSPVAAVSRSADKLDVFCAGCDGFTYTAAWEPAFRDGWHGWWPVSGLLAVAPTPAQSTG
jgi:hypothetical protein